MAVMRTSVPQRAWRGKRVGELAAGWNDALQ